MDSIGLLEQLRSAVSAAALAMEPLLTKYQRDNNAQPPLTITSVALHPSSLKDVQMELQSLIDLLKDSDMLALDNFNRIRQSAASLLGTDLAPLDAAMDRLDFSTAITLCESALHRTSG